jgi:hypothetical protein
MKKVKRKSVKSPKKEKQVDQPKSVDDLAIMELSGAHEKTESIDASETDDDENEGLGNGRMERSDRDVLK